MEYAFHWMLYYERNGNPKFCEQYHVSKSMITDLGMMKMKMKITMTTETDHLEWSGWNILEHM